MPSKKSKQTACTECMYESAADTENKRDNIYTCTLYFILQNPNSLTKDLKTPRILWMGNTASYGL